MLSETLVEGLDQYAIGDKLRELRLKKKIGLIELGEHSGLSPAMISKIELGKLYPTLPTLLRLALVFSVGPTTSSQNAAPNRSSLSFGNPTGLCSPANRREKMVMFPIGSKASISLPWNGSSLLS